MLLKIYTFKCILNTNETIDIVEHVITFMFIPFKEI